MKGPARGGAGGPSGPYGVVVLSVNVSVFE
jgi:hypothetical protein